MIKVAIIGSGFGLYGLLPAFLATEGCKVVAICGQQSPRLSTYCAKVGLNNIYSSWSEMLAIEEIDALAIAVTPDAQYKIAKKAIKKGIHIFAEKPLSATLSEAKELAKLSQKLQTTTAVDFIFPEIEEWKVVKEIINKEKYGKLLHVNASWNFLSHDLKNNLATWKTSETKGGGALSFFGSHLLHNVRFFAGDYKVIKSHVAYSKESKNGGDVGFDTLFSTEEGAVGQMHLRCNAKGVQNHTYTFLFEKATVVLESKEAVTSAFVITLYTTKATKRILSSKKIETKSTEDERVREVGEIAKRFIKACKEKAQMSPSFTDGMYVQNQIQQIRRSHIK